MRTARRLTWLIYAVCVLLVVDGLAWVTWQMLSLEQREQAAQQDARQQEAVRLALWRMDGLLSPVIATEAARPYFHYRSFYPAERAYTRMWDELHPGEVLVPSPLLAGPGEYIRLHFESTPSGWLTSPEAPDPEFRDRAESSAMSLPDVLEVEQALNELTAILRGAAAGAQNATLDAAREDKRPDADAALAPARSPPDLQLAEAQQELYAFAKEEREKATDELLSPEAESAEPEEDAGQERSISELQARQRNAYTAREFADSASRAQQSKGGQESDRAPAALGGGSPGPVDRIGDAVSVQTGRFAPVWRRNPSSGDPELLFVRAVTVGGRESTQGFWIDWPALRSAMLAAVADLLPNADLVPLVRGEASPVAVDAATHAGSLLAGVPAVLVPEDMQGAGLRGMTPTRTVLVVAWVAVLAAVVAIAAVLRAALALSERRGRFVSAVTHELRTPLTTFCLYSQMLDDGMVREESRRAEYLGTLRRESERLATIVENVLAFARIGAKAAPASAHGVRELLDQITPSLAEAATQAGMTLGVDAEGVDLLRVGSDRSSLERILGNLVDNACKYARDAEDQRIVLRVRGLGRGVEFRVRDFGPGIPGRERRRVFSPFIRARTHGADGSSGLGLGLALARSVARSLGGDLRLGKATGPGAEFVLWLPAGQG
ncbi:MAG: HAMP domain-containing histidine kinase [Phycisphaerales bacterium]|nr:HAMP domain-containing histidine kinase [Phycisphaerales bacterium]